MQIRHAVISGYFNFQDEILASNDHFTMIKSYPCFIRPTILTNYVFLKKTKWYIFTSMPMLHYAIGDQTMNFDLML